MSVVPLERSPATPAYILRGHSAAIHAAQFLRGNSRLVTGDAEGWIVVWSTATKRAVGVWRAHPKTILGVGSWDDDKVLTHGRDNKLNVWQLRESDEARLSTVLLLDGGAGEGTQPWLLHSLTVNALNFCAFAACASGQKPDSDGCSGLLVATPGAEDGCVNVTSLPDECRVVTVPPPAGRDVSTGMVMALGLHCPSEHALLVVAGYESGHAAVWRHAAGQCQNVYLHQAHAQPVLSLGLAVSLGSFFTSSADAIVACHPLDGSGDGPKRVVQTRHAGQQSLRVRSDERIFATAGWDRRARVYSTKSMKELAVLKWHSEGCYALAFAAVETGAVSESDEVARTEQSVVTRQPTVSERRIERAKATHWLAVGSKDGKVSLWDIF